MITLKKLIWDNCFSYGESNILELDEHTLTQIVGTNGVGKSSIPLIIEEALYNKNSKGVKKADIVKDKEVDVIFVATYLNKVDKEKFGLNEDSFLVSLYSVSILVNCSLLEPSTHSLTKSLRKLPPPDFSAL